MIQRRLLFLRKYSLLFKQFVAYVKGDGGVVESVDYLYSKFTQAPNASILQIPTSYKTSVLYNQEPFNPSEDFDVIRNSTVTRVAPNGLLEEIGVNVPCIDYETGEPLLLTQPQSTNKVRYSEDVTQWELLSGATRQGGFSDPRGGNNAYKISGAGSAARENLSSLLATDARSIWARTVSGSGTAQLCTFNENTNNLFTITEEWQRFEVIGDTLELGSLAFYGVDFRGSGTLNEIILFGAQAEEQDFVTSYIPTNGSVATRLGDKIQNAGSTDTINSEEGVLYFEGAALTNVDGVAPRNLSLSDGTGDNRLLWKYDDTSNRVQFFYRKDLVNIATVTVDSVQVLEINSFVLAYDDEKLYTYINEVLESVVVLSDTPFSANTLNTLSFDQGTGGSNLYAKTKELRVYKSIAEAQIDLPYIT